MGNNNKKHKKYVGLYGNIAIQKGWCSKCRTTAFILEGTYACCGGEVHEDIPEKYKRETEAEQRRSIPKKEDQENVLFIQDNKCAYCGIELGKHVIRKGKAIRLEIHWDHFIPYSFSQNNYSYNFVAACHICNKIKSDLCFKTISEAQAYIQEKREKRGIL